MKPAKVSLLRRLLHSLKHVDCNIVKRFPSTLKNVKLLLIFLLFVPVSSVCAEDIYQNFEELKNNEDPSDYSIVTKETGSPVLVLAIHGGGIEGGTSELARELSQQYSMYLFEGLKTSGNSVLHITSTHFDEPQALKLVASHEYVISLHGYAGEDQQIQIGGTDRSRAAELVSELQEAGFPAELLGTDHPHAGVSPNNIANKSKTGLSIQLEMSTGFRESLFGIFSLKSRSTTQNERFYDFTEVLTHFMQNSY
ncbi:poly-gamma-glutamate hydrolase family protein [Bacillus mojavensis]|uniref:poly-gamma-glutamate hydrolase family protein n=1 Tax=Bacillus mojavensis TaxID=72360 RepID=UPI002DBC5D67|nr:poly-gamma-glutamate hydrolase family protein [Bacillus mojavensis]MEC1289580.1 poly-gamma-glutamate hydrolase family protein [Bacillus mojavensis]MEC1704529.1 poly-gamma-glutamate hydrolase family protein [Bacillus mojavensis]MEC5246027.1 poly-gamma-glutamate hydrolase family protein [Bacillus mojavensis]